MLFITQILKNPANDQYVMYLGQSDDMKSSVYLTEDLKEDTTLGNTPEPFKPYPFLHGFGFFGCVNTEELFRAVDKDALKNFIKSGGEDTKAKDLLYNYLQEMEE